MYISRHSGAFQNINKISGISGQQGGLYSYYMASLFMKNGIFKKTDYFLILKS